MARGTPDVHLLAETLTELLRPALPFLHAAGKNAAEKAGEKLGSEAWETARKVWSKLRPGAGAETTAAAAAATDLAAEPDDDELNAATQRYLDLLVDLYRYLDFGGMGISERVPLRLPLLEMYMPLKARIEMPEGETSAPKSGMPAVSRPCCPSASAASA